MEENRRSFVATFGPWLGVLLLLLVVRAGANHIRTAQEEIVETARAEALSGALSEPVAGAEATAADTAATDAASAESSDTGAEVQVSDVVTDATSAPAGTVVMPGMGQGPGGMGRGPGGGNTRMFHMATIPEEYAGVMSPTPADAESIARGEPLFLQNCATCHGETGLGDGPAAATLDPTPPMIAMTSQMLGDDYLFWRISEGGAMEPFNSAMPTWKAVLDEDQRWDVINYVRSLGQAQGLGGGQGAGVGRSAQDEAAMRAEMLSAAVEQGVLTQDQADLFDSVHTLIDERRAAEPDRQFSGTMRDLQDQILQELVDDGSVAPDDAEAFNEVLTMMEEAGLMQ